MTHTMTLLFSENFSVYSLVLAGIVGVSGGFFLRLAINAKQKRNILKLENEMLSNHSRILNLEKKITNLERENFELSKTGHKKVELKAS